MEIITTTIAVSGFLLSLYNFISAKINARENYSFCVVDSSRLHNRSIRFLVCFENRSESPLTIVSVCFAGQQCELLPKPISGDSSAWNFRHTDHFPLCVPAHGAIYSYLEFVKLNDVPQPLEIDTPVTFEIRSTRRVSRKTVLLKLAAGYLPT